MVIEISIVVSQHGGGHFNVDFITNNYCHFSRIQPVAVRNSNFYDFHKSCIKFFILNTILKSRPMNMWGVVSPDIFTRMHDLGFIIDTKNDHHLIENTYKP